jgi:hypothetical protein
MNPKPEHDGTGWKTPKILLDLQIEELGVNMSKFQVCRLTFYIVSYIAFVVPRLAVLPRGAGALQLGDAL